MSKLYDLLDSIVTKLKSTESSVPKKVSDLEQDVKTSWDDLEGKPFGKINNWTPVLENATATHDVNITGSFSELKYSEREQPIVQEVRYIVDNVSYDTFIQSSPGWVPSWPVAGNAKCISSAANEEISTMPSAPFCFRLVDSSTVKFYFEDKGDHVVSIYYNTPETVLMDEQFIPESIARTEDIPEVPEHTWESLPDKPFGEEATLGDTLTWDRNVGGKTFIDLSGNGSAGLVKICDTPPQLSDFVNGFSYIDSASETTTFASDEMVDTGSGLLCIDGAYVCVALDDNVSMEGITFPEKGVYVVWTTGYYIQSLTIPGYGKFETETIKTIDPKFLPIDAITQSVIDALPTAEGGSF